MNLKDDCRLAKCSGLTALLNLTFYSVVIWVVEEQCVDQVGSS